MEAEPDPGFGNADSVSSKVASPKPERLRINFKLDLRSTGSKSRLEASRQKAGMPTRSHNSQLRFPLGKDGICQGIQARPACFHSTIPSRNPARYSQWNVPLPPNSCFSLESRTPWKHKRLRTVTSGPGLDPLPQKLPRE